MKKLLGGIVFVYFIFLFFVNPVAVDPKRIVNIYNWADFMDPAILEKFTQETGIEVHYNVFDSNEVLEAKLLSGKTGYDVVFPTAYPYFQRLKQAKVFKKIDKTKLKNFILIDKDILNKLKPIDSDNDYGIPYLWGTSGFAYNVEKVESILGTEIVPSWSTLFDPKILEKLSVCGVSLLDSPVELFPAVLKSQGKDPNSSDPLDLQSAVNILLPLRTYVRKFNSVVINDLASGELCLAHTWSTDARIARDRSKQNHIRYIIPQEGTSIWIDMIAIPEDAPNPEEAHVFIDFILKPENISAITNSVQCANPIPSSNPFIKPEILKDEIIYPSRQILEKSYTDQLFSSKFERMRNRAMVKIKTGR